MTAPDVRRAAAEIDGYRPDLEGLRAVAVVLVLLYHASVPGMAGGYVGVDVFFVISGFLITGLLLRELRRSGTISLPNFYARRARRLLPASALVLLVTVVLSALWMPPLRVPDVAGDAASAALYVSNIHFALGATDYLQAEAAPSPILHFWSLSLEEQFYLFWPALLLLVARLTRGRDLGRSVGLVALVVIVASFGTSLYLTEANAPWAFFSLMTRAWELGLGAMLAIGATRLATLPVRPAALAAWVGLGMIALSAVVIKASTPYPGLAALLPTVGSALVIAGGFRQSSYAPGRWLSTAIPRFLGRISYSLYLWHWPLLVIPAAALDTALPWWGRAGLVAAAIGCAAATQRWVEAPFREGRWIGMLPRRNLVAAGALTLVVASVSLGIGLRSANALGRETGTNAPDAEAQLERILDGATSPDRLPTLGGPVPADLLPSIALARDIQPAPYGDGCHANQDDVVSPVCLYGDPNGTTKVVLFGDSHAVAWFPSVDRLAKERGWRLVSLTKSACSSVDMRQWSETLKREYTECADWRANAFDRIAALAPELVLVTDSRLFRAVDDAGDQVEGDAATEVWRAGIARTIARLEMSARHVVLIADTPRSQYDVPVCLSAHLDDVLACATRTREAVNPAWLEEERDAAATNGAGFVDPTRWVCPTDPCPAVIGSYMVFLDQHHLTPAFASALHRRLGDAVDAVTR